ncbi:hypothetical protein V8C35DRAFT_329060 [Trichoderma chlorosporum]
MIGENQALGQGNAQDSTQITSSSKEAELAEQQCTNLSKSQELWNAAYDSLAENQDTAKLVRSYVMTLTTVLKTTLSDAEVAANLNDRTKRQDFMRKLVEESQARLSTISNVMNGVSDVAKFVLWVKELVNAAVQNIPQAALPWAGVCIGLQILMIPANATKSNLDGIAYVVSRMEWYCAVSEYLLKTQQVEESRSIWPRLEKEIICLYKALLLYQMKSICSYYQHRGLNFLRDLVNRNDCDDAFEAVKAAEDVLRIDLDQYIKVQEKNMLEQLLQRAKEMTELLGDLRQTLQDLVILQKSNLDEKNKQCLRDLFVVDPQDDMKKIEKNKDTLLSQANSWIFQMEEYQAFIDWGNSASVLPPCRLLWIKGHAGTGKTMLLMGIIRELLSHSATFAPKVSHFFCQGTVKALNTATATLRCLIWMLLVQQPHLISHLKSKYDNAGLSLFEGDCAFINLDGVLESMLMDPELSPVYLVVDALDECEQGLSHLKKLIFKSLTISDKVKWLVSSRPTVDLKSPETERSLIELDPQKLQIPVKVFINYKLSVLQTRPGYTGEILEHLEKEISKRAENTFLWVALVFKELDREDGNQIVVDGMYALDIIREIPSGLSKLYDYMMNKIDRGLRKDREYCRNVLVAATLAFRPLTLSEVTVLAQLPDNFPATIVRKCGSFLTVQDETVYLIHQSAKEYLQGNHGSKLWQFNGQPAAMSQGHEDLAIYSIKALSSNLKQNMYNLDYGFKPKDMKPPQPDPLAPIRYSCAFWADHLDAANGECLEHTKTLADGGVTWTFLRERFLHWLESLSLLESLPESVDSIKKLLCIAQKSNINPQLTRFLEDAEKFIRSHGSIIERAPLQAYASALVFSPTASEVKVAQWKHRLPFINILAGVETHWDAHRQTLEAHSIVMSAAFSPNGRILASALWDRTILLWEVSTGSRKRTLEGHRNVISSITFSPSGEMLASVSRDNTIRLWDVSTGSRKWILEGHSGVVSCVAFSPDGKILVSSSSDKTVRLWDIALGSCRQTIEEYSDWVRSISFSPDGKTLASASDNEPIRLWDIATGKHQQTLEMIGWVSFGYVAFSPDGDILAASSADGTIQLWDTDSWRRRQTLEAKTSSVSSFAFSPDGKMLAYVGSANTIRLWDVDSTSRQAMNEEHINWHYQRLKIMAFSPDGKSLVSASHNSFQVWDTVTGRCRQTISSLFTEDIFKRKAIIVFSPNGKTLAVASGDEVQLRDTATWACQLVQKGAQPLNSQSTPFVAFSPDSKTLVTGSQGTTIQCWLWDAATGNTLWTLRGNEVRSVAFSPDGKTLASASLGAIELWDAAMGTHQQSLNLNGQWGSSPLLVFSPSGRMLASASHSGIKLWHATTGSNPQEVTGRWSHLGNLNNDGRFSIFTLGFSSDGTYLLVNYRPIRLASTTDSLEQRSNEDSSETLLSFDDEHWINLNGKKIIWLPANYRPFSPGLSAVHGNKMAWTNEAGCQMFLHITFTEGMLWPTESSGTISFDAEELLVV